MELLGRLFRTGGGGGFFREKDRALFRVVAAAGKAPPSLDAMKNPGVHITPSFCSSTEETAVVAEAMQVIRDYGISHVAPEHVNFFERQQNHLTRPPTVNMQRVTGRDEEQPWMRSAASVKSSERPSSKEMVSDSSSDRYSSSSCAMSMDLPAAQAWREAWKEGERERARERRGGAPVLGEVADGLEQVREALRRAGGYDGGGRHGAFSSESGKRQVKSTQLAVHLTQQVGRPSKF